MGAHVKQIGSKIKWGEAKYIDQHNYYANRKMKEAIYKNAYALASFIDPIWKAVSSTVQNISKTSISAS